jgi:hypothetical protein
LGDGIDLCVFGEERCKALPSARTCLALLFYLFRNLIMVVNVACCTQIEGSYIKVSENMLIIMAAVDI